MKKVHLFFFSWILAHSCPAQTGELHIIPEPVRVSVLQGAFLLSPSTRISATGPGAMGVAGMLAESIGRPTGYRLTPRPERRSTGAGNEIVLSIRSTPDSSIGKEGYVLKVRHDRISLSANAAAGLFYGVQTLLQMLPPEIACKTVVRGLQWKVPCAIITDYPRFGWRGLLLDVSRHFFAKEFLLQYIDQMAKYKFNVFHLHLTDDQGWRIEIKGLPGLTAVGAWRVPRTGSWWSFSPPQPGEAATYGGYYTQDDIREIVDYAGKRFVTIVPEIDVPAHCLALLAAYPGLSCTQQQYYVNPGSRFRNECNVLCVANDSTWLVLDKIFTQVAELFPGQYIHVGGDEANRTFWEHHAPDRELMEREGIRDLAGLQSYFTKRLERLILSKGKKMIGWDEILEGGVAPEAAVMSWRGMQGGVKAAKMGHSVVMTPSHYTYLDLYQGDPLVEPETYSMLRLDTCYAFEPIPEGIDAKYILGGQGNLWAESVPNERQAEYMTWPRGFALAEAVWSPKDRRQWPDFIRRMEWGFRYLDAGKVNYSRSVYDAIISGMKVAGSPDGRTIGGGDSIRVKLATEIGGLDIYYTFDGTDPDTFSARYAGNPLAIPAGASQIRVRTYRDGVAIGRQINCPLKLLKDRIENN